MPGAIKSLNVSNAAAVALYALTRGAEDRSGSTGSNRLETMALNAMATIKPQLGPTCRMSRVRAAMNAILRQPQRAETIKSVTLADLQFDRPLAFDRLKSLARTALMLWGALAFGAAAGTAAYFVAGTGEPILVARASTEAPASEAPRETNETTVALAEIPPHLSEFVGKFEANAGEALPDPVVEARMPRPRPDEPVYTGSWSARARWSGAAPSAHARRWRISARATSSACAAARPRLRAAASAAVVRPGLLLS